uniref:Astacin domain-containing protein n=1 Tax=Parastrongyloides trichosuri TaxID=131310 RepID=A0A0N5A0K8_PARTI
MLFIKNIFYLSILFVVCVKVYCYKKWPYGRIPYVLDQKIRKNNALKTTLYNTITDLNKQTCLKFFPKTEKDESFVEFKYYSRNPSCWNFLKYKKGSNRIAAGPSCLAPNNTTNKHIFTDCDIQYINLMYKCPKYKPTILNCSSSYTITIDQNENSSYIFNEKRKKLDFKPNFVKKISSQNKVVEKIKKGLNKQNLIGNYSILTTSTSKSNDIPSLNNFNFTSTKVILKTTTPSIREDLIKTSFLELIKDKINKKSNLNLRNMNNTCGENCNFNGYLKRVFVLYNGNFNVKDSILETDTLSLKQLQSDNYIVQNANAFIANNEDNNGCLCTIPLYRLYNSLLSDHFYTTNETEFKTARTINGYKFEKIEGYCTQYAGCGAFLPLYRFYNPIFSDHLYTTDEKEMIFYKSNPIHGYIFEKIECYLWKRESNKENCSEI